MANFRSRADGNFASGRTLSFRIHTSGGASAAAVQADWIAQLTGFWTNGAHGIETLIPTGTVLKSCTTSELSPLFRQMTTVENTLTLAGTSADDSMPEQDVVLVSLRGATVERSNRGRIHLPALAETAATGGLIGVTESTRVSTAIGALFGGMRTAGYTVFVYNTKVSVHDPVLYTPKTILSEEVDRVIRTLRVRSRKNPAVYA